MMLIRIRQLIIIFLGQRTMYQWLLFTLLLGLILLISVWQQHAFFDHKIITLQQKLSSEYTKNRVLKNTLEQRQKGSLEGTTVLTNDQIAERFEQWSQAGNAQIIALDFSAHDDDRLHVIRINGDFIATMPDILRMLETTLGDNLFIELLAISQRNVEQLTLRLQLVQPIVAEL